MSYDLMVFNKESAPKSRTQFMQWYDEQTSWVEDHGNVSLIHVTRPLRNWLSEMVKIFPAAHGPFSHSMQNNLADYSLGRDIIYISFAEPAAKAAYATTLALAGKHNVGFFDVSSENGAIIFPENGKLVALGIPRKKATEKKAWWTGVSWLSSQRAR